MVVKNDFQYPVTDAPNNRFMQWIKDSTGTKDIFLAREELLDPVTLSGRRNFFGHRYYLSVMGYNISERQELTKRFFEAKSTIDLDTMRKEGIDYMVIPKHAIPDFNYTIHRTFLEKELINTYEDGKITVFKL